MTEGGAPVEVVWTWTSLLQVAFTTGLCTATFNQVLAWTKESFQRRQKDRVDGRTLALQLVELLTAYAQECNSRIDANLYDDRTGGYARYSEMPILKPFPEGGPWGLLPPKLAARIRDLRNEVDEAAREIMGVSEVDGPPDAANVATSRYGTIGYTSLRLAQGLRRHYRLGYYQAAGESTFEVQLRKRHRASHPGPLKRLWRSLPVERFRRWLFRLYSRTKTALSQLHGRSEG
jgi:hypothetical protein